MSREGLMGFVAFAVIFGLEGIFPHDTGRRQRWRHALPNLAVFFLNGVVTVLLAGGMERWLGWAGEHNIGALRLGNGVSLARFILAFLVFDFWMYAWHRMNHEFKFFWRFHRMHHTERAMDSTTALRFHPGEILFSTFLNGAVLALLGWTWQGFLFYRMVLMPVILFHHSNIRWPEGVDRLFKMFIVTPEMHRVHHSAHQPETDSNYGSIFSWWDRLFVSFRTLVDTRRIIFGLTDFCEEKWQKPVGMLRTPFV